MEKEWERERDAIRFGFRLGKGKLGVETIGKMKGNGNETRKSLIEIRKKMGKDLVEIMNDKKKETKSQNTQQLHDKTLNGDDTSNTIRECGISCELGSSSRNRSEDEGFPSHPPCSGHSKLFIPPSSTTRRSTYRC